MNLSTVLIGLVVLAIFTAIVVGEVRKRKSGGCGCGCGCSGCSNTACANGQSPTENTD